MKEKLTTVFGAPVADNNNSMTAGQKVLCLCKMFGI